MVDNYVLIDYATAGGNAMHIEKELQIALISAILCILAPLSVPLPFTPVPVSLTLLVIFIAAYILPPLSCTLSVLIYLLIGMAGLPVFSGYSGGLWKLSGPTGGYLIGFLFSALIASAAVHAFTKNRLLQAAGMVAGLAVCYLFGTLWFSLQQHMSFVASLSLCVIPFLPADAAKIVASVLIGPVISARIKKARLST